MRKVIAIFLSLVFVLSLCGCKSEDKAEPEETSSKVSSDEPFTLFPAESVGNFEVTDKAVVCFGDSITESMGMKTGYRYPQQLQANISNQYRVFNAGVGGEKSYAIMSRANAIDFYLISDITFKAGEDRVLLDDKFFKVDEENGEIKYNAMGFELETQNVIIGEKAFKIVRDADKKRYLVRTDTSSELTLKGGTKCRFDYSQYFDKIYCAVVLMGANDGGDSVVNAEFLIENYKKMEQICENFIAIVPFYGEDYSAEFEAAFGNKALNIRKYFVTDAAKDYDVTLTEMDNYLASKNIIPATFNYENKRKDCHLNELGYKILADQVYKKGVELGYWK